MAYFERKRFILSDFFAGLMYDVTQDELRTYAEVQQKERNLMNFRQERRSSFLPTYLGAGFSFVFGPVPFLNQKIHESMDMGDHLWHGFIALVGAYMCVSGIKAIRGYGKKISGLETQIKDLLTTPEYQRAQVVVDRLS